MPLPDADWKNRSHHLLDWLSIALGVMLIVLYLSQWWRGGDGVSLGLVAILFVGGVVYFTGYWQPMLYLVAAVIVSVATVVWILMGRWGQPLVQVAIVLHVVFVLLGIYLFNHEELGLGPDSE